MNFNGPEERLAHLHQFFPTLNLAEVPENLQSLLDEDSFIERANNNVVETSKTKHLPVNTDDEDKDLVEALKLYKKKKSKPSKVTKNLRESCVNASDTDETQKLFQVNGNNKKVGTKDAQNVVTEIFKKYEQLGAIPKKLFNDNVCKETKSSRKQTLKNDRSQSPYNDTVLSKNREKKNQTKKKAVNSEGFFYIVPENPVPAVCLPKGSYYVIPKDPSINARVVFHPQQSPSNEYLQAFQKVDVSETATLNNLDLPPVRNSSFWSDNYNISSLKNVNDVANLSAGVQEVSAFRTLIEGKIDELKSTLAKFIENLNVAEYDTNLRTDSNKMEKIHRRKIVITNDNDSEHNDKSNEVVNHYSLIALLFPFEDKEYLRQKVEGCEGNNELLENFVDSECKRLMAEPDFELKFNEDFRFLLSELPDQCPKYLFKIWSRAVGYKEIISQFVINEKAQMKLQKMHTFLLQEFSDLNDELAWRSAQQYLNSQKSFEDFIEDERLKRKIETQLGRMVEALPEKSLPELAEKAQQFQGNEDLVEEYIADCIRETLRQSRMLNLQLILPDVDPQFIKEKAEKFDGTEDDFNSFINNLLESQDYPKLSTDKEALKRQQLWNTYVTNFNIKEYLLRVPNPDKFLGRESDNNPAEMSLVLDFLESRYGTVPTDLENIYSNCNRNLTVICAIMDNFNSPIPLSFSGFQFKNFNERFLQEITYIDKCQEIDAYVLELKTKQAIEKEEARLDNAFLMCPLCADEELIPSNTVTCPDGHVFCSDCIIRYVNVKLGDGVYKFACPTENCDVFFTYKTLETLLPEDMRAIIIKKQQAIEIINAEVDGLESCPFCEFSYIPDPGDKIFVCQNPECLMETCRQCKDPNHIPLRCEEVERPKDLEARKIIEEAMTNKLIRICPTCGKKFVKIDGCNKMICTCGTIICYICRQKITGYSHFNGSPDASPDATCPLHSTNDELHNTQVMEEGIQRRDALLQEDPSLRVNVNI